MKTITQLINDLTWYNLVEKLKEILKKITNQRSYKVYTALLNQTGTNAPIATILENTLGGNISWSRQNVGYYSATFSDTFPPQSTFVLSSSNYMQFSSAVITTSIVSTMSISGSNIIDIQIGDLIDNTAKDSKLFDYPIEIRIYN
jgi:hypothetical protein